MSVADTIIFLTIPLLIFIGIILYLIFFGKPRYQSAEGKEDREAWMKQLGFISSDGKTAVSAGIKLLENLYDNTSFNLLDQYVKPDDNRLYVGYISSSGTTEDSQYSYEAIAVCLHQSAISEVVLYHLPAMEGISGKLIQASTRLRTPNHLSRRYLKNETMNHLFTLYTPELEPLTFFDDSLLTSLSGKGYFIMHNKGGVILIRLFVIPPAESSFEHATTKLLGITAELLKK